ncbi:hypothetical protein C8R44DRAFT_974109 [Mycena epipterygia]|nr:hypothetical protein C8R44DRAFT_974109 [Mycena epipterygia]
MPRVDTIPARRSKREAANQPASRVARSASSRSTGSISAPVKLEPSILSAASPQINLSATTWRHPAELPYIRTNGEAWHDMAIIRFLRANALSIPPRSASTADPWVHVRVGPGSDGDGMDMGGNTCAPPARFQWTSLALVLGADGSIRQREWDAAKFEILHIARLCAALVDSARAAGTQGAMDRGWRCAQFDRPLRRYWNRWFIMRDEFVRDFHREFEEEEYDGDVLKLGWGQWVLRGHKGFALSKEDVASGICATEFMQGFIIDEEHGTFEWIEDSPANQTQTQSPPPIQKPPPAAESQSPASPAPQTASIPDTSTITEGQHATCPEVRNKTTNPEEKEKTISNIPEAAYPSPIAAGTRAGCAPFRGHPTDVFKALLAEKRVGNTSPSVECEAGGANAECDARGQGQIGDGSVEAEGADKNEDGMEGIEESQVNIAENAPVDDEVLELEDEDEDEDDDLQLLYPPTSPAKPITNKPPPDSRSPSPLSPLSFARFSGTGSSASESNSSSLTPASTALLAPSVPGGISSSYPSSPSSSHLVADAPSSPHHLAAVRSPARAFVALLDADAGNGLLGRWSEELRLLRAEVGALRAEVRAAPHPTSAEPQPTFQFNARHGHSHPLQHLIEGEDIHGDGDTDVSAGARMDVDVDGGASLGDGTGAGTTTMVKYAGPTGGEPLPPRSRKFTTNGTMRFAVA